MGKKIRISDESVNCYGTRILTSGIDLSQYERCPVLMYMHDRGKVVGVVKNLERKGTELLGEMEFDKASPLSIQLEKQYEFGSLRMVSANLRILETSDDKALVQEGQTRQTITRCQLFEVSCVDIGGNHNAFVLSDQEGNLLQLSDQGADSTLLPLLNSNQNNNPLKKVTNMEMKQLALAMGLAETATDAEITAKINEMKLAATQVTDLKNQVDNLKKQQDAVTLSSITSAVESAIKEKRISEQMKDHFVELGKKVGIESLRLTLDAIQPHQKLSAQLRRTGAGVQSADAAIIGNYTKLSDVPAGEMMDLRTNHRPEYVKLYRAEYGVDPVFEE